MSKYITSIISTVVHLDDRNPIFGDDITTITIDDDACGGYIVLTQNDVPIRVDPEELLLIAKTAIKMLAKYKKHEE
jgi:hypothetical protein